MTIVVTTAKKNGFRLHQDDGRDTFEMTLDPSQHTAYNHTAKMGFEMLRKFVNDDVVKEVYLNSIKYWTTADHLWSPEGKWLGVRCTYILEHAATK